MPDVLCKNFHRAVQTRSDIVCKAADESDPRLKHAVSARVVRWFRSRKNRHQPPARKRLKSKGENDARHAWFPGACWSSFLACQLLHSEVIGPYLCIFEFESTLYDSSPTPGDRYRVLATFPSAMYSASFERRPLRGS